MNKKTFGFGKQLATIRTTKGLSQREFAKKLGVSQRMIVYYENHAKRPPTEKLEDMAQILDVTVNELLGLKNIKQKTVDRKNIYLQKKLQLVERLPKDEQKTITRLIDTLAKNHNL